MLYLASQSPRYIVLLHDMYSVWLCFQNSMSVLICHVEVLIRLWWSLYYFFRWQIREFFVTQKTRVRKQVRLSREKVITSNTHVLQDDGVLENINATNHIDPVPLNSTHPEACSVSRGEGETVALMPPEDIPPDISDSDKYFIENIFSLLRKEETFSGQVKLMEWIMQIQDSSVLIWY